MPLTHFDRDLALGSMGNILMLHWFGATTDDALDRAAGLMDALCAAHPRGVVQFITVHESSAMPNAAARNRMHRSLQRTSQQTLAAVVVLEGTGFVLSAKRGVMTGMSMLFRPEYPLAVLSRVDQAVEQLFSWGVVSGADRGQLIDASLELAACAPFRREGGSRRSAL